MAELLIGCGNNRVKQIRAAERSGEGWQDLTTLDNTADCRPDVEWDLERLPLPFPDEKFDEIHAYHVLEHTGRQGDFRFFFAQFTDFWRMLKPGGVFCGIVPGPNSGWVWGDPGHTRAFRPELLTFLNQPEYTNQVGVTAMADYRHIYAADFDKLVSEPLPNDPEAWFFVLRAVKPSRITR